MTFIAANRLIRGIDIAAPVGDWSASQYGMTANRLAALTAAGYNTLRIFFDTDPFMAAVSDADMTAAVTTYMSNVQNAVNAGFKVMISLSQNGTKLISILDDGANTAQFSRALKFIAAEIVNRYNPQRVCLEVMNEPPADNLLSKSWPTYFAPLFHAAIRTVPGTLTTVWQGAGGWFGALPSFNLASFDGNTVFAFHPYEPGEFTHQGLAGREYLYGVTMPASRYTGGRAQMKTDTRARIDADGGLSAGQKTTLKATYDAQVDYLFDNDGTFQDWTALTSWMSSTGISPLRVLPGEFGVVSNINFNSSPGTDLTSRVNFYRAVRNRSAALGLGGWIAHQALGDFNLFQQTDMTTQGETLIPELTAALFS